MLRAEENGKSGGSTEQEEHQNLSEKLADDARSLRSQSLPNRDLASSRAGAGQQQIGDIDAADQEDQPHRTKEQNERLANAADHGFSERNQAHGPFDLCRILGRILLF